MAIDPKKFQGKTEDNVSYVYNRLIKEGFNHTAAMAFIGNMMHETMGLQATEELSENKKGTKGLGALQWTGPRRTVFEKWLKDNGKKADDIVANMDFFFEEAVGETSHWVPAYINGERVRTSLNRFKNFEGSIEEATKFFMSGYLRPEGHTLNNNDLTAGGGKYNERLKYATSLTPDGNYNISRHENIVGKDELETEAYDKYRYFEEKRKDNIPSITLDKNNLPTIDPNMYIDPMEYNKVLDREYAIEAMSGAVRKYTDDIDFSDSSMDEDDQYLLKRNISENLLDSKEDTPFAKMMYDKILMDKESIASVNLVKEQCKNLNYDRENAVKAEQVIKEDSNKEFKLGGLISPKVSNKQYSREEDNLASLKTKLKE